MKVLIKVRLILGTVDPGQIVIHSSFVIFEEVTSQIKFSS